MDKVSFPRLWSKNFQIAMWAGAFLVIGLFWLIIICSGSASAQRVRGELEVEYVGADYRDPLELPPALRAPAVAPEEVLVGPEVEVELPRLNVEGMVWGSGRPQAIIGGELLDKGDVIKGAQILDITKDGVVLLYKNRRFIIRPKNQNKKDK